jgi:hypothetical protein
MPVNIDELLPTAKEIQKAAALRYQIIDFPDGVSGDIGITTALG